MTDLVLRGSRFGPNVMLNNTVLTVPLDAEVSEFFQLPVGFGDFLGRIMYSSIGTLSGAYVAPAPAFDGFQWYITDDQGATNYDIVGASRFVVTGTATARPTLTAAIERFERFYLRGSGMRERLYVRAPVIAGAGVTGTVHCSIVGQRINTA